MLAMIWFREASSTKLQMPILYEGFSLQRTHDARERSIIAARARAINFFMVNTFLS